MGVASTPIGAGRGGRWSLYLLALVRGRNAERMDIHCAGAARVGNAGRSSSSLLRMRKPTAYRMTVRRTASASSAICKGPSMPSAMTRDWNQPGSSGSGLGFSRTMAPKLYSSAWPARTIIEGGSDEVRLRAEGGSVEVRDPAEGGFFK